MSVWSLLAEQWDTGEPPPVTYDRTVLVSVLVYHWPTNTSGCWCGWARLGASFPEHVADVYEASVAARSATAMSALDVAELARTWRRNHRVSDRAMVRDLMGNW